jgi:hypothetical protein
VKTADHIIVPECAYFIEVRAVANDLVFSETSIKAVLVECRQGHLFDPSEEPSFWEENSRFPAHSVYDNRCGGALVPMQEHLRPSRLTVFGTDQRNANVL